MMAQTIVAEENKLMKEEELIPDELVIESVVSNGEKDEEIKAKEEINKETLSPPTDSHGFFRNYCDETKHTIECPLPQSIIMRREKKWLHMLDNWNDYMVNKFETIKKRCRKGIPSSLRGRAWKHLCGAQFHMHVGRNKNVFDILVDQEADPKYVDDIRKDLDRQFPEHEMFAGKSAYGENGKKDLFTLLKTYTVLHPDEGYCQAQAPVAAVLLMHMPLKEAFYCFVQICHKYLPGYYVPGLEQFHIDGEILNYLLKPKSATTYYHFKKNLVEHTYYTIEWYLCIFCRTLPWPAVLRIWDMFFCEGIKVLFKVSLVILKELFGSKAECNKYPDLISILTRFKNLPEDLLREDVLIKKMNELNLDEYDLEQAHHRIIKTRNLRFKKESKS
uniref:Rab-GAP TBC domain-containing protein n=1 Tax=Rhabditophanes sp. KR3021 TaxID=114890 RepID=A0AC35TPG0_9BILA